MNTDLIKCVVTVCLYLILFYFFGFGYSKCMKKDGKTVNLILSGIFVYMSFFSFITIIIKFLQLPLHVLTNVWWGILILYILVIFLKFSSDILQVSKKKLLQIRTDIKIQFILIILILIQIIIIENVNITASPADTYYYVGTVNVDLFYDNLGINNYLDGTKLESFAGADFFETYLNHSAVMCKALGIHPLLEIRTVNVAVVIIIFNLIIYDIGVVWFENKKMALILVGICAIFQMFFTSFYMPGYFLTIRTYEGKSILANIIISAIFLYMLKIVKNNNLKFNWIQLFFVIITAYSYSASSIFLIPFILFAYFIVLIFYKKSFKELKYMFLCSIYPCCMIIITWFMQNNMIGIIK